VGATRFYARREIKDVLAYLRLLLNPSDDVSLLRIINVPPRKIGSKTVTEVQRWARRMGLAIYPALQLWINGSGSVDAPPVGTRAKKALEAFIGMIQELRAAAETLSVSDLIAFLLERTGYGAYLTKDGSEEAQGRYENVIELQNVAMSLYVEPGENPLSVFLERVSLVSDVDNLSEERDGVTLLTLHASKGLEFSVVFITGMEEGLIPHSRSVDDAEELEEERRLFYVGVTRARDRLYLLHTFRRTRYGENDSNRKSRFLAEIPPELTTSGVGRSTASRSPFREQSSREHEQSYRTPVYVPGVQVEHPTLGRGTVVSVKAKEGEEEISVAFAGKGIKKFLARLAKLKTL
jgi:DNA helicase-2/ATP-dependent DNA helicase PcrA